LKVVSTEAAGGGGRLFEMGLLLSSKWPLAAAKAAAAPVSPGRDVGDTKDTIVATFTSLYRLVKKRPVPRKGAT
jgi:hypothetical protein